MDNVSQIEKITRKQVAFKTSHEEQKQFLPCLNFIVKELERNKIKAEIGMHNSFPFLISGPQKTDVLLLGHVDIVPAPNKLFKTKIHRGKMFGRGVFDMKGAIAALLDAFIKLKAKNIPNLTLAITSDEEIGGYNGTRFLIQTKKIIPDIVILPDGGNNFNIVVNQKGPINLTTTTHGRECHSALPWAGKNPINLAAGFIRNINKKFPNRHFLKTTATPTIISSGDVINKKVRNQIPNSLEINWNIRIAHPDTVKDVSIIFGKIGTDSNTKVTEIIGDGLPLHTNINNKAVKLWKKIVENQIKKRVRFVSSPTASDARWVSQNGIPCIVTNADGGCPHEDGEWVDLKSLLTLSRCIQEFTLRVNSRNI